MKEVKLRIMSIVHGKSEFYLSNSIKSNLKIKHEIIAKDRGKHSIQVNSILQILNDKRFKTFNNFIKAFPDIEIKKKKLIHFKLFIIMDLDDCNEIQKKNYLSKEMFKKHWLYEYIIPIYNDPNLEYTMKDIGVAIQNKKEYIRIFPTNHGDLNIDIAKEFYNKLKTSKKSNLSEYIKYCLDIVESDANSF